MTYQIIYSSDSATPMQSEDLEEILEQARRSNSKFGVTGALLYVDGVFLQILEGDFKIVRELMSKIAADVRHEEVTVLQEAEIQAPVFGDWKMAYVSATSQQVAEWAGLAGTTAVPEVLDDMRGNSVMVAQIAQSILAVLSSNSSNSSNSTDPLPDA